MPAQLTLRLSGPRRRPAPRQLLGAAASLFENVGSDHEAAVKPFAVGPLSWAAANGPGSAPDSAEWMLGWLSCDQIPATWPPATVRFGPSEHRVLGFSGDLRPYSALAAAGPARRVRMRAVSPMFFSRNGRDLPLPEPVLLVRSLIARWNAHAPAEMTIDDDAARDVVGGVFLAAMMKGATEQVTMTPQLRQIGFVGDIELGLLRDSSSRAGEVFGALMRFAAIAGVGAQTTHGFGAVEVTIADRTGAYPHTGK